MFFDVFWDAIFIWKLIQNEANMASKTIQKSIQNLMVFWIDFWTDFGWILRAPTLNPTHWHRCFLRVRLPRLVAHFHPNCAREWSQNQCKIHPKTVPKSVQESDLFFYGFLTSKWSLRPPFWSQSDHQKASKKLEAKTIGFWGSGGPRPPKTRPRPRKIRGWILTAT